MSVENIIARTHLDAELNRCHIPLNEYYRLASIIFGSEEFKNFEAGGMGFSRLGDTVRFSFDYDTSKMDLANVVTVLSVRTGLDFNLISDKDGVGFILYKFRDKSEDRTGSPPIAEITAYPLK